MAHAPCAGRTIGITVALVTPPSSEQRPSFAGKRQREPQRRPSQAMIIRRPFRPAPRSTGPCLPPDQSPDLLKRSGPDWRRSQKKRATPRFCRALSFFKHLVRRAQPARQCRVGLGFRRVVHIHGHGRKRRRKNADVVGKAETPESGRARCPPEESDSPARRE